MTHDASPSVPPPRRARGILLLGLAALGLASALFVLRRPLMMSAPTCLAGRWHGCYDTFNGVVLMTLVTLPVSALVVWALARRRHGAWRTSLAEVGMVHGTVPFLWLTMMPGAGAGVVPGRLSLVPLRDLVTMGPLGIAGNLLVLASLGFFAPMRWAALASVPRILALGAGCSVLVETAQYVLRLDRVSSVDDVLVNTAGAVLAGLASRRWWRGTATERAHRSRLASAPEPAPEPADRVS
ncbi:VanZ family protein [Streptomyces sp. NPDC053493]|uniref:VanZ family protein n=1 Tax=Streptomyces sp. NPDC053493 TaxID=3365705 RepID=UPI0037D11F82